MGADGRGVEGAVAADRRRMGYPEYLEGLAGELAPSVAGDPGFRDWFVTHMRRSLSPGAAVAFVRMTGEVDVSDVLAAVRVPTLILHRPSMAGPPSTSPSASGTRR